MRFAERPKGSVDRVSIGHRIVMDAASFLETLRTIADGQVDLYESTDVSFAGLVEYLRIERLSRGTVLLSYRVRPQHGEPRDVVPAPASERGHVVPFDELVAEATTAAEAVVAHAVDAGIAFDAGPIEAIRRDVAALREAVGIDP